MHFFETQKYDLIPILNNTLTFQLGGNKNAKSIYEIYYRFVSFQSG